MNHSFDVGNAADNLGACLACQKQAYFAQQNPTYEQRKSDLQALSRLIVENKTRLVAAIQQDFGSRSEFETLFADVFAILDGIKHAIRNLKKWMKPQRRTVDLFLFASARNRVIPQPVGVVGLIVPWNFPLNLALMPLVSIFAAGNRAMVKMSENSQHLAKVLIEICPTYFAKDKLVFFADSGVGFGAEFSALPFDHLMFTGSTATGKAVMASAAPNLTPVTLELGGKSPAIVDSNFAINVAAARILWAKCFNAGQICTNVDYVFIPEGSIDAFIDASKAYFAKSYPDINSEDYTSIIDERSYSRLENMLQETIQSGVQVINLAQAQVPDRTKRKFSPHIVVNPPDTLMVSSCEIFGPILPIRTYTNKEDVLNYINQHDRPLALYIYSNDRALQRFYIENTMSGAVGINDALLHMAQHDLPFGGVGASGMGHYHGFEGFITFSKLRPVFYQGFISSTRLFFSPPYHARKFELMNFLIRLKK